MDTEISMEWNETLLKMARPNIYRTNAFRVLNVSVTTSIKDIQARIRKHDLMEKYASIENPNSSFFPLDITRDYGARHEALQRLLDPELRFIDEFFWFWPLSLNANEDNDEAQQAILKNDFSHAISIWKGREAQGSEANVSMHNLAILHHTMALDIEHIETKEGKVSAQLVEQKQSYWNEAFARWKALLNDEGFWQRVQERTRDLDDPRLMNNTAQRIREGLPKALLAINAMLAVEAAEMNDYPDMDFHIMTMNRSGFDNSIIQSAIHRALTPIRNHLDAMCLHALEETRDAPKHSNRVASNLITDTAPLLDNLDRFLPEGDSGRESAHDGVALQVRACLIAYINETDDWRTASKIASKALSIAGSSSLRQKIQDDLEAIRLNEENTTCWFCGRDAADSYSSITVMMHGNVERDSTQVRWQKLPVIVPRCAACKSVHQKNGTLKRGGMVSAWILAIVLGIATTSFWVGVISLGISIAVVYVVAALITPNWTKPESQTKEFRIVKEMILKGWRIGERPQGVS